ncbi:MAG TPA: 50S ribosomal protein L31 [Thermoflexales bacterium]|jgi:large subunit ribosomal protein L31|nr:50S ribosomal protein L31 [Anaerolineae bacterium]HQV29338.1 50S ribosomal protein L31 [Thermoflexales bacterium]HQY26840.1 50S ribosomal protein L31 [Thermoflexales bacterium]HQZ53088.1 50S ribosomal protein L31 [Thermoflexales bacterium]HRA55670.1 50S ribosomal protein L31 [Thermoflexales bacterium]
MKPNIHPKYFHDAKVFVGGQLVGTVGSTKPELHLDVWSGTHPFYTGEQRIIDTEGQVDRFQKRLERRSSDAVTKVEKQVKRRAKRQIAEFVDDVETPAAPAETDADASDE